MKVWPYCCQYLSDRAENGMIYIEESYICHYIYLFQVKHSKIEQKHINRGEDVEKTKTAVRRNRLSLGSEKSRIARMSTLNVNNFNAEHDIGVCYVARCAVFLH